MRRSGEELPVQAEATVCAKALWCLRNQRKPHAAQRVGKKGSGGDDVREVKGALFPRVASNWRALSWGGDRI